MINDSYNFMDVDSLTITDISEMITGSGHVFYARGLVISRKGIITEINLYSDKEDGLYCKSLPEVE